MAPMRPLWLVRSRDGSPMAEPPRFALARDTRAPRRRAGRGGHRRHARAGARCGRARRGRLRAAAGGDRRARGAGAGRAATARLARPAMSASAGRAGDEAAVRAAFRRRAARRRDRSRQQPPGRRRDRAARGDRHRRAGRRQAHALHLDAGAASHPPPGAEQLGIARERAARGFARCRRRLRLQGQALPGGGDRRLGGAPAAAARCAGWRRAARASSPTTRRATTSPMPSSRSTPTASSWRCALRPSPISAPMSRPSAPPSRARSTARCSPAATARPRSSSRRPACSPTRRRPMPFAAPAGPRPATCWSGWPTPPRASSASTAPRSGGATSFRPTAMPYKTPIGPTYDCGDFPEDLRPRARARRL